MKTTNKQMKKLVLDTQKIKVLDARHLTAVVGGGGSRTVTCGSTTNGAGG
jgi:hypothetical protein